VTPARILGSVTCIAPPDAFDGPVAPVPRPAWASGDYVMGVVCGEGPNNVVELPDGRMTEVLPGDAVVGALGTRAATLEVVGDWRDVGDDLVLEGLTSAGVLGKATSTARVLGRLLTLEYAGHLHDAEGPLRMADFALAPPEHTTPFAVPTVLIVGTSMSAGKTTSARTIIRRLGAQGLRVAGAKLSGVARRRDVLAMRDAGAAEIVDFVDAGLPSTMCPPDELGPALDAVLARVAESGADVLVAEAGASPLEPYGGETVVEKLGGAVALVVLCASDPYAVAGVMSAFHLVPDFVTGRAASTEAARQLVARLAAVPALDLLDPGSFGALDALLAERLALAVPAAV
jgi:hypothetical protein